MIRDSQRNKVYTWERSVVSPRDTIRIPLDRIQGLVNYIWRAEGLEYPPVVEPLHTNDTAGGRGCRTRVRFPEHGTYTWIVIHELAHAMNSSIFSEEDAEINDIHGPNFVGIYVNLINKYLKIDLMLLLGSIKAHKIKINHNAKPTMK